MALRGKMSKPSEPSRPPERPERPESLEVEPGFDRRLASILKKALNTPPSRLVPKRKTTRPGK